MGKSFFNITVVLQLLLMTVSLISGHFGPHFGQSGLGPRPLNQFLTPGSQRSFLYLSENKPFHYDNITNFVVFGDSHSFHGTDFDTMKPSKKILSSRKNWPIPLANLHNMTLWNFAVSGAVISLNITYREGYPVDLVKQYELFDERMPNGQKYADRWNSDNTLFAVYMGSNDVFDVIKVNNTKTWSQNLDDILNVLYTTVENIYEVGGRHFLLVNIPPLYDAPVNAGGKKYHYVTETIPYFDYFLKAKAQKFARQHPDANVLLYNLHAEYSHILNKYQDYKFISSIKSWKTDPESHHHLKNLDKYFWRDFQHISNRANLLIAEDMETFLEKLS